LKKKKNVNHSSYETDSIFKTIHIITGSKEKKKEEFRWELLLRLGGKGNI